MRNKQNKRPGLTWIAGGLLLLTAALSLTLYNIWDDHRAGQAAQDVVEQLDEIIPKPVAEPTIIPEREMPTEEIDGERYIGELSIPDLDLNLPVMADWDYDKLKISPCRYSGSYYTRDLVIAGHNYVRHFSSLRWIDEGADICFTNVEGEQFHYTVKKVETLQDEDVSDMIEKDDWDLTLFTCNRGGQTRCTVRCVESE